ERPENPIHSGLTVDDIGAVECNPVTDHRRDTFHEGVVKDIGSANASDRNPKANLLRAVWSVVDAWPVPTRLTREELKSTWYTPCQGGAYEVPRRIDVHSQRGSIYNAQQERILLACDPSNFVLFLVDDWISRTLRL